MIPDDVDRSAADFKARANAKLAQDLGAMFNNIAKLAMRASAELSDLENDPGAAPKIRKAHSVVTLMIDDAMRGLNEATGAALACATFSALDVAESDRDQSEP